MTGVGRGRASVSGPGERSGGTAPLVGPCYLFFFIFSLPLFFPRPCLVYRPRSSAALIRAAYLHGAIKHFSGAQRAGLEQVEKAGAHQLHNLTMEKRYGHVRGAAPTGKNIDAVLAPGIPGGAAAAEG